MSERFPIDPAEPLSPRLRAAFDQLAEGVIVTDEAGTIVFINQAAVAIHGMEALGVGPSAYSETYSLQRLDGTPYPNDALPLTRAVARGEAVEDVHWRIARADGKMVIALGTARPIHDDDGRQIGAVLTLRDETERETERQALESAVALQELLLKEIHHRVKNNLQLVSSLLSLQGRKTHDPGVQRVLGDLSARVDVIADIHRALYETGEGDHIDVVDYIRLLATRQLAPLGEGFGVAFNIEADGRCHLPIEKATSVALAINELVLNSLQHAFGDSQAPAITLALRAQASALEITYRDNGAGAGRNMTGGQSAASGFGSLIIRGLEKQLGAHIAECETGEGFGLAITIPFAGNAVDVP